QLAERRARQARTSSSSTIPGTRITWAASMRAPRPSGRIRTRATAMRRCWTRTPIAGPWRASGRVDAVVDDRETPTAIGSLPDAGINVGRTERWVSGIAGAALLGYSLKARRLRGLLLPAGLGLIGRAATGRSRINRALGRNSARHGLTSSVATLGEGTR